jgi:predicted DNA binding CopG/RHH family protein
MVTHRRLYKSSILIVYYMMTKDTHIRVYLTAETKQKIKQKAEEEGLDPSPWMRSLAKQQLAGEQA